MLAAVKPKGAKVNKNRDTAGWDSATQSEMITKIIKIRELKKTRSMLFKFQELDEDGSGELDLNEFLALTSAQIEFEQMTEEQMTNAFHRMDMDGSGNITWDEFKKYYIKMVKSSVKTQDPYPMSDMYMLENRWQQLRKRIYLVLFGGSSIDENKAVRQVFPESEWVGSFLAFCVFLSTLGFALETVYDWKKYRIWDIIELSCTLVFTIEYLLRIVVVRNRKRYAISADAIIDLFSWLPTYIVLLVEVTNGNMSAEEKYLLEAVRTLRVIRTLRVSRWESFESYFRFYSETVDYATTSLTMLMLVIFLTVFVCAALTYAVEPEEFSDVFEACYWCIVVQTTLGYGDIYPKTPLGMAGTCVSVIAGLLNITFAINIMDSCLGEAYATFLASELTRLKTTMKDLETSKKHHEEMENFEMERQRDKLRVTRILDYSSGKGLGKTPEGNGPNGFSRQMSFTSAFWPTGGRTNDEINLEQAVGTTGAKPSSSDEKSGDKNAGQPGIDLVQDRKEYVRACLSLADTLMNLETKQEVFWMLKSADVAQIASLRGLNSTL